MNEVGAVNEFLEARDDSSILNSGKALLTSWNGPVADPPTSSRVDLLHLAHDPKILLCFLRIGRIFHARNVDFSVPVLYSNQLSERERD